MKRVFALLTCVALMVAMMVTTSATPVAAAGIDAGPEDTILIAFSDFQPKDGISGGKQRLQQLADTLKSYGLKEADSVLVGGDYNASGSYYDQSSINTNVKSMDAIREVFSPFVGENVIFAQGNHDLAATPGLAPNGNNDPASGEYGLYIIPEDQFGEWGDTTNETKEAAKALKSYLDRKISKGWKKPIFIVNHVPLHWGNRTLVDGSGSQAYQLFDVINEAGEKGLNIIYLFGHNHSSGYDDFLGSSAIYLKKGDKIQIAQGTKYEVKTETLNFTYMNAGYVGYNSSKDGSADTDLTLSVFLIHGNAVIITRYDANGIHNLKSAGIWNASFASEGYHATPNETVYVSSRRVTATEDVKVDSPRYDNAVKPTTTTTQTTTTTTTILKPIITGQPKPSSTTSQKPTSSATTLPTASTTGSTTASPIGSTTGSSDPIGTGTPSVEVPSVTDSSATPTDALTTTTEPIYGPGVEGDDIVTTTTAASTTAAAQNGEEKNTSGTPDKPFPVGLVVGIGGGILVVAAVVIFLVIKRKK